MILTDITELYQFSGATSALVGISLINALGENKFLYKSCLFNVLFTQQSFGISRQILYICIFVAYTISNFDHTAVNATVSEILMQ